jgi:hypothetical protein
MNQIDAKKKVGKKKLEKKKENNKPLLAYP